MARFATSRSREARRALDALDEAVDRRLDAHRSPFLDRVNYPLSSAADHSLLWHVAGLARAWKTNDPTFALRFSAAMGVESFLTNVVIKSAFERVRPNRPAEAPMLYGLRRPITSSFPSGHATAAFCAATLLSRDSRAAPLWYVLAAMVASTRVYVRLHHTSDIVAGAALGVALAYALRPLLPPSPRESR